MMLGRTRAHWAPLLVLVAALLAGIQSVAGDATGPEVAVHQAPRPEAHESLREAAAAVRAVEQRAKEEAAAEEEPERTLEAVQPAKPVATAPGAAISKATVDGEDDDEDDEDDDDDEDEDDKDGRHKRCDKNKDGEKDGKNDGHRCRKGRKHFWRRHRHFVIAGAGALLFGICVGCFYCRQRRRRNQRAAAEQAHVTDEGVLVRGTAAEFQRAVEMEGPPVTSYASGSDAQDPAGKAPALPEVAMTPNGPAYVIPITPNGQASMKRPLVENQGNVPSRTTTT